MTLHFQTYVTTVFTAMTAVFKAVAAENINGGSSNQYILSLHQ